MPTTPEPGPAELRVHGVSGVSAERILDHPIVLRVAGDAHAGFYRPRPATGPAGGAAPGVAVEAYRWGALTAGAAVRTASMLLLLPFMLANLSIWLRPTRTDRLGLLGALCRLLAGTLTAAFVLSIIGITMDLVGWQCVPYHECRAGRPYLSWLAVLPPGPRLALLALLPLLALRVVWAIGTRSARAFGGFDPRLGPPAQESTEGLDAPGFWHDERTTAWLRQLHLGVGAGVVAASLTAAVVTGGHPAGWAVFAAATGLILCCAALLCLPTPIRPAVTRCALPALRVAVVAVTVLSLGYACLARHVTPRIGQLPGYEGSAGGLITAQGVLLIVLAAVTVRRRRGVRREIPPFLRGLGTPIVAAAAVSVGAAFTATLVYRVADLLDRGAIPDPIRPNPRSYGPLEPPVAYWWAALAALLSMVILSVAAAGALSLSRRRRQRMAAAIVARDYPDAPPQARARLRVVHRTVAEAQVIEELGPMLVSFFVISALGLATIALDLIGTGPTELAARLAGRHTGVATFAAYVTDLSIWVLSLAVIGLLLVGFRAYRSAETRRVIAALWDIGTFWPRTAHPFAPPCYAARAVPELAKRVSALAAAGPVVISGHSHGSVLAAATILQLPPRVLRRVALLSHGSPLERIYARLYPAYLGRETLCDVGDRLGWRWLNLWRDTDPIGGAIFPRHDDRADHRADHRADDRADHAAVDVRLRDPRAVTIDPTDTVPPPVERHWPYHSQPEYQAAVRRLVDRIDRPDGGPGPP
ncbi:hypothetical protein [Plantactinospora sp. KBS50]|uniref:hypothetical protein n=1 Tax=Plantactinospora sp. KBS50 TaxID=2024580 RepID=UPI000BAB1D76|nr:hypothetical protein [Plantactinospora sp. KBS50]ASW54455.1 hypothetical protein CIK06_10040 [Plantactinospora sp. KBS50]